MRSWCLALLLPVLACDRGAPPPAAPRPSAAVAPPATAAAPAPSRISSADVDTLLRAEWQKAGVAPTPRADDATWLRRAWIDVLGTIPPPEVTRRFLADGAKDKRARAIDEMLASPLWADHWTAYWDEVWMGRDTRAPDVDRGAFRAWLHDAFAKDRPWDQIVTQLLTATGLNSTGGPRKAAYLDDGHGAVPEGVNGAVNWTLRYQLDPQDMAGNASRSLLGVQIQCAQCHDHKTEKWTQKDFQGFAAAFVRTRLVPLDRGKSMGEIKRVELHDLDHAAPRFAKMSDLDPIEKAQPRALDGTELTGRDGGVRAALARWVTSPKNEWFARALVNRVWGHFLGRGFVDPVDDLRPSNPAAAPALLDALAADFVTGGYHLKELVRLVVGSEAYALSAAPLPEATAKVDPEVKLWERFRVTPLGPEELLNALVAATRVDSVIRAMGRMDLEEIRAKVKQRYGFLFDVDEEADAGDYEGTIAQGLALLNGGVVAAGASVLPGSALADVLGAPGDDESKLEAIYLRTLCRLPAQDEVERWTAFLAAAQSAADVPAPAAPTPAAASPRPGPGAGKKRAPDPLARVEKRAAAGAPSARVRAWEDLLWALLNSSEFVLNH
jgi:hypothetical protein